MIKNKESKAYQIAQELAAIWQKDGKQKAVEFWNAHYADDPCMPFWVQCAIGDTVLTLVKERNVQHV